MCGRFTVKATWAELVVLYRLTMCAPRTICGHAPGDAANRRFGPTADLIGFLGNTLHGLHAVTGSL
jgi:hypothetical protein